MSFEVPFQVSASTRSAIRGGRYERSIPQAGKCDINTIPNRHLADLVVNSN